jgi:hypothetical protein
MNPTLIHLGNGNVNKFSQQENTKNKNKKIQKPSEKNSEGFFMPVMYFFE